MDTLDHYDFQSVPILSVDWTQIHNTFVLHCHSSSFPETSRLLLERIGSPHGQGSKLDFNPYTGDKILMLLTAIHSVSLSFCMHSGLHVRLVQYVGWRYCVVLSHKRKLYIPTHAASLLRKPYNIY